MQPTLSRMKEVPLVKRFIMVLAVMAIMAAMVAATAVPAFAIQSFKGEQGPPAFNVGGNINSAVVVHCNSEFVQSGQPGTEGTIPTNKNNQGGQGNCS